jgi:pyridoxine 5'-phosphate synthase PdxJ
VGCGNLGDHAMAMIKDGVRGLSVQLRTDQTHVRLDGVREIRQAWLDHVGLCRDPAHAEACITWPRREVPHRETAEVTEARVGALDRKLRRPAERRRLERIGIALR